MRKRPIATLSQAGRQGVVMLPLAKELIAAQLVVEASTEQFVFRHALTRQVIYSDLLGRERQALHRTIAETMMQLYRTSARLESYLPELAYHFYEAGVWDKALEYVQRAGEKAHALDTPRSHRAVYAGVGCSPPEEALGPQPELNHHRGRVYESLGDFEQARTDYEAALQIAQTTQDR